MSSCCLYALYSTLILACLLRVSECIKPNQTDGNTICNRNQFTLEYVFKNKTLDKATQNKQLSVCNFTTKCQSKAYAWMNYGEVGESTIQVGGWDLNKRVGKWIGHASLENGNSSPDKRTACWGYLLELRNKNDNLLHQLYYGFREKEMNNDMRFQWKIALKETYFVRLISLPYQVIQNQKFKMPVNRCQQKSRYKLAKIYWIEVDKVNYNCPMYDENNLQSMAEYICEQIGSIVTDVKINSIINDRIEFKLCSFDFNPPPTLDSNSDGSDTPLSTIALSVAGSTVVLLIVSAALIYWKLRQRIGIQLSQRNDDDGKSVFILHEEGCDEYDHFVQGFASLLTSLGMHIQSSLHNRTTVDSEGGLVAFYKQQIEVCSTIIVVCKDMFREDDINIDSNDTSFASALKYLQILQKKVIYVYLDQCYTQQWHQKILPKKYLQIPKDIQKLQKSILSDSKQNLANAGILQVMINKMEAERQNLVAEHHPRCYSSHCKKGLKEEVNEGVVFLSQASSENQSNFITPSAISISTRIDKCKRYLAATNPLDPLQEAGSEPLYPLQEAVTKSLDQLKATQGCLESTTYEMIENDKSEHQVNERGAHLTCKPNEPKLHVCEITEL